MKVRWFLSRRLTAAALAAMLTAGTAVTVWAEETGQQEGKEEGQPIVILHTTDVHCGVDDNIGYAGLALYEKQMKQLTPYVTLVDAGDAVQGAPIGTLSEGSYLIDIMNELGYDIAVPGNHEFDYGMDRFMDLAAGLDCGYTSCNFMDLTTGQTVFKPYQMLTYGDTMVAYVGISTPESFTKSTPACFQDGLGNYLYSFCEDSTGDALYRQVQTTVDAAKAAGADYVIGVGHLGHGGITERWTSEAVISATAGIDAFIDGHSHETVSSKTVKNKEGKDVLLTQSGTKLEEIGKVTIQPDGSITAELITEIPDMPAAGTYVVKPGDTLSRIAKRSLGSYGLWGQIYEQNRDKLSNPDFLLPGMVLTVSGAVASEDGKAVDASTDAFIKKIQKQYEKTIETVLGYSDYPLTSSFPGTEERAVRKAETNLGDFCADAFREVLGADVGLMNGGGIRADLPSGKITYKDMLTVFPFGNMACVARISGQQLKDALEMAARNYPEENGSFLHVSGMTYELDPSVLSGVVLDDKRNFVRVDGAYRVKNIMVGGEPLDVTKTYTVAAHQYYLKNSGDGMNMLSQGEILQDEVMVDVDVLTTYFGMLGGKVTGEYAAPEGQGRIVISEN